MPFQKGNKASPGRPKLTPDNIREYLDRNKSKHNGMGYDRVAYYINHTEEQGRRVSYKVLSGLMGYDTVPPAKRIYELIKQREATLHENEPTQ